MNRPSQQYLFGGAGPARAERPAYQSSPAGYAAPPGSGAQGETCGTCTHCCIRRIHDRNIYKCGQRVERWTLDRSSDVLLRSPACRKWQAGKPQLTTAWGRKL